MADESITRADVDALKGPAVVEFGTSWCGHCRAAQPVIASALANHPRVRHIKIEDGSGRRLGRSFTVLSKVARIVGCAATAVAVLTALAPGFRCALAVVGEVP